jgi:HSP20 family molecular chaperone IbpA
VAEAERDLRGTVTAPSSGELLAGRVLGAGQLFLARIYKVLDVVLKVSLLPKKKFAKEPETEEEESTTVLTPEVCIDHDDAAYYIEVELPGVDKEHVDLSVGPHSLCVEAAREDVVYLGCFSLAHPVDETKAKAKYENGLLRVEVPLKAPVKGKRIKIE